MAGEGDRTCHVQAHDRGQSQILKSYDFSLQDRTWYTARVRVRGNHFECSIYDSSNVTETRVFDILDHRHPRGRVGLGTFVSAYRFKNIKVTTPDGRVLWDGLPAIESTKPTELLRTVATSRQFAASQEDWVPLFNGKNIAGWTAWGGQGVLPVERTPPASGRSVAAFCTAPGACLTSSARVATTATSASARRPRSTMAAIRGFSSASPRDRAMFRAMRLRSTARTRTRTRRVHFTKYPSQRSKSAQALYPPTPGSC